MQTLGVALLALLFAVPGGTPAHATPPDPPVIPVRATFRQPRDIVDDFTRAVDRGELIICRRPLERSAIIPVRVEYVYDLRTLLPTIKVYSRLRQAIPVPDDPDYEIREVSALLSDGAITETEIHVWPR
jgi:hypothetical protein